MKTSSPPSADRTAGLPGLAIVSLWALIVFIRYFSTLGKALPYLGTFFDAGAYPPREPVLFRRIMGESLRILLVSGLVLWVACSWGGFTRRWLSLEPPNRPLGWALDFGLGAVFLELFWIGTGLARIWYTPVLAGGAAALALLPIIRAFRSLRSGSRILPSIRLPRDPGNILLLAAGSVCLAVTVLQDLAPETFYDSMVYHLAVPAYWIQNHGLRDLSTNFFSSYPYGAECFFLNGLAFQGTEAAKILHAASFGACALLAAGWAAEIAGERAGWTALGLVLTLPLLSLNAWSSQVEGFLGLSIVLCLYALFRSHRAGTTRPEWILAAGLFGGLAISAKYTAALALGSAFVVLLLMEPSRFARKSWKGWALFLAGGLFMTAPWALKNFSYTGDPVFPYLPSFFHGRFLPAGGYARLLQEQHARVTTDILSWLYLPWTLTMGGQDSYNFCGPVALALFPALFLFRVKNKALKFLAWTSVGYFAAGLAVTHILRFMVPAFILLYIPLASALSGRDQPPWGRIAAIGAGLSGFLCLVYLAAISHFYYGGAGIWTGRESRAQYLEGPGKITPYYSMAAWISAHTPPDARLLLVGDARGLYYDRPFLSNTVFDGQVLALAARGEKDAEGIGRRLKEMGVDYLAVNGAEGIRVSADYGHYDLSAAEWARLDEFIQRGTELVYARNLRGVYRILPALKNPSAVETPDLILFFSAPATRFVKEVQKRQWSDAQRDLDQAAGLYPFSAYWRDQKLQFDKAVGAGHG